MRILYVHCVINTTRIYYYSMSFKSQSGVVDTIYIYFFLGLSDFHAHKIDLHHLLFQITSSDIRSDTPHSDRVQ